jgi:hypothetical protein
MLWLPVLLQAAALKGSQLPVIRTFMQNSCWVAAECGGQCRAGVRRQWLPAQMLMTTAGQHAGGAATVPPGQ